MNQETQVKLKALLMSIRDITTNINQLKARREELLADMSQVIPKKAIMKLLG